MKKRYFAIIVIIVFYFIARMQLSKTIKETNNSPFVELNLDTLNLNILVYSKANGWYHEEAIPAAKEMLSSLAKENNWVITFLDDASIYNSNQLKLFDIVLWNNVTGSTLNKEQRLNFKKYIEQGGSFIGIHGSGDNSGTWDWYYDEVINARFSHHPMVPQYQIGVLNKECPPGFPKCDTLISQWNQEEEWYVFYESPRKKGAKILYTLDETNLVMSGVLEDGTLADKDFGMPEDHPIVWYNCIKKGKVFYSALGHKSEYYKNLHYKQLLKEVINWAGNPAIKCE